jgi:hypothetical protein
MPQCRRPGCMNFVLLAGQLCGQCRSRSEELMAGFKDVVQQKMSGSAGLGGGWGSSGPLADDEVQSAIWEPPSAPAVPPPAPVILQDQPELLVEETFADDAIVAQKNKPKRK